MPNAHTHLKPDDGETHWIWAIIIFALLGVLGRLLVGDIGATRVDPGAVGEPVPAAEAEATSPAAAPRTP